MKGRELQREIIKSANRLGWACATFPPVETARGWRTPAGAQGKGWPDITLVRDRVVFAEVKGTDTVRPDQRLWANRLLLAGAEVHLWTPVQWEDGSVMGVLEMQRPSPEWLRDMAEELSRTLLRV